jgi:hypothetical protein
MVTELGGRRESVVDSGTIEDETKGTARLGNSEPITKEGRRLILARDDVAGLETSDEPRLFLRLTGWWRAAACRTRKGTARGAGDRDGEASRRDLTDELGTTITKVYATNSEVVAVRWQRRGIGFTRGGGNEISSRQNGVAGGVGRREGMLSTHAQGE